MKISKTSWHARLYQFIWHENPPSNLCPYFWKLIAAGILFLIIFPFQLPLRIAQLTKWGRDNVRVGDEPVFLETFNGALAWVILILLSMHLHNTYHLIKALIGSYSYNSNCASIAACIWIGIAIVFTIIFITVATRIRSEKTLAERRRIAKERLDRGEIDQHEWWYLHYEREPRKPRKSNLLREFIKAKMGKYCPKIEWI